MTLSVFENYDFFYDFWGYFDKCFFYFELYTSPVHPVRLITSKFYITFPFYSSLARALTHTHTHTSAINTHSSKTTAGGTINKFGESFGFGAQQPCPLLLVYPLRILSPCVI